MNRLTAGIAIVSMGVVVTGCFTMSPEERRAACQEECNRLISMPPVKPVETPDRDISNVAKMSADLFNIEFHPMLKAYVAATETSREYTGFMNDIQYYVEEEKMSGAEALKKVYEAVINGDAKLPDDQKVWPKILKGIAAVNELKPKRQVEKLVVLISRNTEIGNSAQNLGNKFKGFDLATVQRGKECAAIVNQTSETGKCLYFLKDQYERVVELEEYAR